MTKRRWITTAALLAAVIVALMVVVAVVNRGQDTPKSETGPSADPAPETSASAPLGSENSSPGSIETDVLGRQVIVPNSRSGDVLPGQADDGGTCENISSPAGMQIQRINAYPVLFSTNSGPTKSDGAVPTGYAEGPRGAVLAGINSYMLMMSGGTPGREMVLDHVAASDKVRQSLSDVAEGYDSGPSKQIASVAFRVRSCTDAAVVVEYALPQLGDETAAFPDPKWRVVSILVLKEQGQWKMSVDKEAFHDKGITENREGFIEWDL